MVNQVHRRDARVEYLNLTAAKRSLTYFYYLKRADSESFSLFISQCPEDPNIEILLATSNLYLLEWPQNTDDQARNFRCSSLLNEKVVLVQQDGQIGEIAELGQRLADGLPLWH